MTSRTAKEITIDLLRRLVGPQGASVGARLWDGTPWPSDPVQADVQPRPVTLVLKHPGALRAMFLAGNEVALGEAYLYDDIDLEGNAEAVFDLAKALPERTRGLAARLGLAADLLRLPSHPPARATSRGRAHLAGRRHSLARDRQAVAYHYDVSNDFYRLWLDERLVYSCAYFTSPNDDLDSAQVRKLEYICRKLRLRPGQRLLDLGCGWGGLALYAAQHYGVDATGITLSAPQAELANARIAAAGLGARCRVLLQDYREVPTKADYDALVSVGMFEHVGLALLPAYFRRALGLLRPQGVFLNHGIASSVTQPEARGRTFSNTYVFPDGELASIGDTLRAAEAVGFEVRDVESLREHYALTLRHWLHRLEAQHARAAALVGEPTYRVWRLYMSGSAHGFASGRLNVYQALLVKSDADGASGLPLRRADWYT